MLVGEVILKSLNIKPYPTINISSGEGKLKTAEQLQTEAMLQGMERSPSPEKGLGFRVPDLGSGGLGFRWMRG